jgi:hypothetical protein
LAPPVLASPTKAGFLKKNSAMATPPASVTIARFVPRKRSAGSPTTTPNAAAIVAASSGATGNGMSQFIASFDSENPAIPAKAIWANDVWPPNPVMTTNESAITVAITVVMIAPRHSGPSASSPITAAPTGTSTAIGVTFAAGTAGSFQRSTVPRSGIRSPNSTIATMMTRNGRPSRAP